jgi:hypothetical protein
MTKPLAPTSHLRPMTVAEERLAVRCARGRVVLIDDDTEILAALTALIELEGYACESYESALAYLQVLNYNRPCFPAPVASCATSRCRSSMDLNYNAA